MFARACLYKPCFRFMLGGWCSWNNGQRCLFFSLSLCAHILLGKCHGLVSRPSAALWKEAAGGWSSRVEQPQGNKEETDFPSWNEQELHSAGPSIHPTPLISAFISSFCFSCVQILFSWSLNKMWGILFFSASFHPQTCLLGLHAKPSICDNCA